MPENKLLKCAKCPPNKYTNLKISNYTYNNDNAFDYFFHGI